ncbi:MAG TPA: 30S ribosomal protein S17 [Armatimonadota bacterium]|nr:30S ribosomal protein S17 [Armatimonadota bacterium]
MSETQTRGMRRTKEGIVVSDRMDKTVVVAVQRLVRHPLYRRVIRQTRRFKAHDATNDCHVGDRVRIVESRPFSKEKKWRVVDVIERAK